MVDYRKAAAAFRAKAAKTPYPEEAKILIAKAEELEAKYGKPVTVPPPFTDNTTTTSRDGRDFRTAPDYMWTSNGYNPFARPPGWEQRNRDAWDTLWNLHRQQRAWNPPPDENDLISDEFKHDPGPDDDEDYGYDIYEGEEYE